MDMKKLSGLLNIIFGLFLLIVVGGVLLLQILAIILGLLLIVKGCRLFGLRTIKMTMNNIYDL